MDGREEKPRPVGRCHQVTSFLKQTSIAVEMIAHDFTRFTSAYRSYELGKGKTVNYSGNHKKSLHLSVTESLKKLQTTYIDLLYLHWWVS